MKQTFFVLIFVIFNFEAKTQITFNQKDIDEIRLLARKKIQKSLPELINTLNLDDVLPEDRKEVVLNSYQPNTDQIFAGDSVMIDDDLNISQKMGDKIVKLSVANYFYKVDSVCKKSEEPTYEISNIVVSEVKRDSNNIVSIRVFFRSFFKGEHFRSKERFKPQEQVANFKVEKVGKRWQVWISKISFNNAYEQVNRTTSQVPLKVPIIAKAKEPKYTKINAKVATVQCEGRLKTLVLQNVATNEFLGAMVLMNLKDGVNIMDEFEDVPYEFEDVCGTMSEANKEQVYIFSKDPIMFRGNSIKVTNMTYKSLQSNGEYTYFLIPKIDFSCE